MRCSSRSSPEAAAVGLHGDGQSVTDGVVLVATIRFLSAAAHTIACRWPSMASGEDSSEAADRGAAAQPARDRARADDQRGALLRVAPARTRGCHDRRARNSEPNGMISVLRRDGVRRTRRTTGKPSALEARRAAALHVSLLPLTLDRSRARRRSTVVATAIVPASSVPTSWCRPHHWASGESVIGTASRAASPRWPTRVVSARRPPRHEVA
jgi:hypothetical protein